MTFRLSTGTRPDGNLGQVEIMKTNLSLTFALLGLAAIAGATPITFTDPFGNGTGSGTDGDVYGELNKFDIQKVVVDVAAGKVDIYTNYGPGSDGTSIAPYSDSNRVYNIGDLFFTVGGALKYGIPLYGHAVPNGGQTGLSVIAGHLYGINNVDSGTLTAREALNDSSMPDSWYRPNEIVLLRNSSNYLTDLGTGSVALDTSGTNPEFKITVTLPGTAQGNFYSDMNGGNWGIHFASASCGNDIIDGRVPEPSTFVLLGGALLGLGLVRRRLA